MAEKPHSNKLLTGVNYIMEYTITTEELVELFSRPEYEVKHYPCEYIKAFEDTNYFGDIHNLTDELFDLLGRFPSQQEYVELGVERAKTFFNTGVNSKGYKSVYINKGGKSSYSMLRWGDKLEANVRNRVARSYASHQVEYTTNVQIRNMEQKYRVGSDLKVDLLMGVDLVVADQKRNKIIYIHIIKNSNASWNSLDRKKFKRLYAQDKNKTKHYWTRNWTDSHIPLAFDSEESESTLLVNGNPMFKSDWLEEQLNIIFNDNTLELDTCKPKGSEILRFYEWLITHQIKGYEKGLIDFWV